MTKDDVDAYWLGTAQSGMSGITLARPLQLEGKPVTRVENYCTTGSEALRAAAYAVASGAYDVAMAVGAEKVKDSGYQGLNAFPIPGDGTARTLTAAAMFSMVAPAYGKKYGVGEDELTEVLARISWKNHQNGARNPRAQFRKEVSTETICASPRVAGRLGVFDCAGVADGAAAAIVVRAEDAHRYTDKPLYIKALSFSAGSGSGLIDPDYDYTWFPECARAAEDAYRQAGITDPRHQLAMAEVHDCFTPTELVLMEDLGFAERGTAWKEVLAGTFDRDGELPVNPDGGPQELRPPGRGLGPADVLRDLAPAARRGHPRAPDPHRPDPGPHPQPRRATPARWCRSSRWSAPSWAEPTGRRAGGLPGASGPAPRARRGTPTRHRHPAGRPRPPRRGRRPAGPGRRGPSRRGRPPSPRGRPRTPCRPRPCRTSGAGRRALVAAMAAAWVS